MGERASLGSFYEEEGETRFSPLKMLFKNSPYFIKIEKYHSIENGLVVSFATNPSLKDSDHWSSRYDHFCEWGSKMHDASEVGRVHLIAFHVAYMW